MPVFELADLDQTPVILSQPLPQYPPSLLSTAAAGEVTVAFVVDADGAVRAARITAATHPEFEVPALQAVARWRFRPGRRDGRAVATRVEVPIAFSVPGRGGPAPLARNPLP
jgi:protein TonB